MKINYFNPFQRFSHNVLLGFGILITILGSLLAFAFNGRYDGILDLHFVNKVEMHQPFLDNLLNIVITTIFLFLLGKKLYKKTRIIDILNAVMISRIFIYLSCFFNIGNFISDIADKVLEHFPEIPMDINMFWLAGFAIVQVFIMVIYIIYMYMGFKLAINSKKSIHILYFLLTLLSSEVLLKILFSYLFY
jgi:hypothetical protein